MGLEIKINQLNVSVFHFSQRLTGKGPDSLEELREIALDAEDEEEEHKEEDEDQQEDGRKADESQDGVEFGTEQSHDHNVPHKEESTTGESWNECTWKILNWKEPLWTHCLVLLECFFALENR